MALICLFDCFSRNKCKKCISLSVVSLIYIEYFINMAPLVSTLEINREDALLANLYFQIQNTTAIFLITF